MPKTKAQLNRERRARLLREGTCPCGKRKVKKGRTLCQVCLDRVTQTNRVKRAERKQAGLCLLCGEPAVAGSYCLTHWFGNVASTHLGSRKGGEQLKKIWDRQHGRCVYSGEKLKPGSTASLDHKVPLSKGGSKSARNMQWVSKKVNYAKRNLSHTEFLEMCRAVAACHP